MPRTPIGSKAGTSGTSRSRTGTSRLPQGSGATLCRSMGYKRLGTSGTSGTTFSTFRMCARDGVRGLSAEPSAKSVSVRRSNLSSLTSLTSPKGYQVIENKGKAICAFLLSDVPKIERDVPDVPVAHLAKTTGCSDEAEKHNMMRKVA